MDLCEDSRIISNVMCGRCKRHGHSSRSLCCPIFAWSCEDIKTGLEIHTNLKNLVKAVFSGIALNPYPSTASDTINIENRYANLSSHELKLKKSRIILESRYQNIDLAKRFTKFISLPREREHHNH